MSKVYEQNQDIRRSIRRGYEASDIKLRPIIMLLLVLTISGVVGHLVLWGLHTFVTNRLASGDPAPPPIARTDQTPPEPRLQVAPRFDLQAMLTEHYQHLSSYGWVDQQNGVVRIPIDEAIRLTAQRGLPVRPDPLPLPESPNFQSSDDYDSEGGHPPQDQSQLQPGNP